MPIPRPIKLHKAPWERSFHCSIGRTLCVDSLHKVFAIPGSTTNIWLIPHKHPGKDRAKLTTTKYHVIHIDEKDLDIRSHWLHVTQSWIKRGYSYISVEYYASTGVIR